MEWPFHAQTASLPWRRSLQVCRFVARHFSRLFTCLRISLEHVAQSTWQNVLPSIIQGTYSSFGTCYWESSDPVSQGRGQDGWGLLSSGVTTDPSEISFSYMILPCAMGFLVICTALWLAAEAGTHPTTMLDIWKYFCIPQGLQAVRSIGWEGWGAVIFTWILKH